MKNVAFIPVRGGSKSIPLKNIKSISGRPLVYWVVKAACECKYIDKVYISTDSKIIKDTIETYIFDTECELFEKAEVINRSFESATDNASTEYAMLEFAEKYSFDNIVLIQATSPLLQSSDLDKGFESFFDDNTDSVISVVRQKRFQWENDKNGFAHPTNYDVFQRPRRQEFNGYMVENGAYYITSKMNLMSSKNRVSGNIKAIEMSEDTYFEIDELSDWIIIEALMKKNGVTSIAKKTSIKLFLTDCDGCLTDGGMYYSENGDEMKKFNTKDGMGFALLKEQGILTGIVTGETVELNRRRAQKLDLDIIESGCKDKLAAIKRICRNYKIGIEDVCYIGDDINDLEAIKAVGYGCCPADAMPEIKAVSKYVTNSKGGEGVIREIVNHLLGRI